jgi:Cu-Zn family superoxide dismutase
MWWGADMQQRRFIALLGSVMPMPLAVRAQQSCTA